MGSAALVVGVLLAILNSTTATRPWWVYFLSLLLAVVGVGLRLEAAILASRGRADDTELERPRDR